MQGNDAGLDMLLGNFLDGPVVKNPPCTAGNEGPNPG